MWEEEAKQPHTTPEEKHVAISVHFFSIFLNENFVVTKLVVYLYTILNDI